MRRLQVGQRLRPRDPVASGGFLHLSSSQTPDRGNSKDPKEVLLASATGAEIEYFNHT